MTSLHPPKPLRGQRGFTSRVSPSSLSGFYRGHLEVIYGGHLNLICHEDVDFMIAHGYYIMESLLRAQTYKAKAHGYGHDCLYFYIIFKTAFIIIETFAGDRN